MKTTVAVVGGGLSGLYISKILEASGIDYKLFEARDRLGGRIFTANGEGDAAKDGFDMGPSWFWPQMQPKLAALIDELNLRSFPQSHQGDVVFERMSREIPKRYQAINQEPQSMRLAGGTAALIDAIRERLTDANIYIGMKVKNVALNESGVRLRMVSNKGQEQVVDAQAVIFALPPRLLEASVTFEPKLESKDSRRWRETPTWMAPHAKFFALYEEAFWQKAGLSGTAQSMVGPLVEIHDATSASGKPALFGFLGVGPEQRKKMGEEALTKACLNQLVRLFGKEALNTTDTILKDWAFDDLTSTFDDVADGSHPEIRNEPWVTGVWENRIFLAGSETSLTEPGYLAGAIEAADRTVSLVKWKLRA